MALWPDFWFACLIGLIMYIVFAAIVIGIGIVCCWMCMGIELFAHQLLGTENITATDASIDDTEPLVEKTYDVGP
jgi:hypothetical protein